jgi:hypothetical protein
VLEPHRNSLQDSVACLMAIRIVYALESIQINEHNSKNPPMPFRLRYSMFQPIVE